MHMLMGRMPFLRVAAAAMLMVAFLGARAPGQADARGKSKDAKKPPAKRGLIINDPRAFQGYTLFSPLRSTKTYLIDMQGRVVRTWQSKYTGLCPYLLDNGNILRAAALKGEEKKFGGGPGHAGRIQEFTWDGALVWDYLLFNDKQLSHHDLTRLPNGNVLVVVWDKKTGAEALAAGRRHVGDYLLPDSVLEIKPTGKTTGDVVWEWHLWDHLIQDHDRTRANYGNVAEHPELVDINYGEDTVAQIAKTKGGADKLKSVGYVGSPMAGKQRVNPDWTHVNSITYNADLDQIMLTVHAFSEFWIIDHGTTTKEAAGHTGGRSGKGGDLLYRWGNPRAYRAGTSKDQRLFSPHFAHWIPRGVPGEGHILVFNNGMRRPEGNYSSVEELVLPVDEQGRYVRKPKAAFGPDQPIWSYTAPKKTDFFSMIISGAQRQPNGNTLICSGVSGIIFEVTPEKDIVWKYVNPAKGEEGPGGGPPPVAPGSPAKGLQLVPPFVQGMLKLSDDQKKQLAALQEEAGTQLDKILTEPQRKQFEEMQKGGPGAFGAPPRPGQIMTAFQQARLKLNAEQKKLIGELQKEAESKLHQTLNNEQKKQLKDMGKAMGRGGPGPGMIPGFGGPGPTSIFRSLRYAPNHPGLLGRDLTPGKTIEELEKNEKKGARSRKST
jgi:hypothetical protein